MSVVQPGKTSCCNFILYTMSPFILCEVHAVPEALSHWLLMAVYYMYYSPMLFRKINAVYKCLIVYNTYIQKIDRYAL